MITILVCSVEESKNIDDWIERSKKCNHSAKLVRPIRIVTNLQSQLAQTTKNRNIRLSLKFEHYFPNELFR